MFERFTEQARRVLVLAARETRLAGRESLAQAGVGAHTLGQVNRAVGAPHQPAAPDDDAMAADAKAALQAAAEHAIADGHAEVGTAHILLGVLDQQGSRALSVLATCG